MKIAKALLILFFALVSLNLKAQYEREAIEEVITEAYVNGSYNKIIPRNIELGFSRNFRREVLTPEGELEISNYYDWLREVENREESAPGNISVRYLKNDIRKGIARVVIQFLVDNKTIRNEYLTLMEFPGGWKIVSLTYQETEE